MPNPTTLEERSQIVELAQEAGLTDKQIAQKIDRSIHTVRKWRRRGMSQGRGALASEMGRPKQGALSSFPEAPRERLLKWRKAHPRWGPKTLRAELEASSEDFGGASSMPSRSSIGRFGKRGGAHPFLREALGVTRSVGSYRYRPPPAVGDGRPGQREGSRRRVVPIYFPPVHFPVMARALR